MQVLSLSIPKISDHTNPVSTNWRYRPGLAFKYCIVDVQQVYGFYIQCIIEKLCLETLVLFPNRIKIRGKTPIELNKSKIGQTKNMY